MSAAEKSLVLETICQSLQESSVVGGLGGRGHCQEPLTHPRCSHGGVSKPGDTGPRGHSVPRQVPKHVTPAATTAVHNPSECTPGAPVDLCMLGAPGLPLLRRWPEPSAADTYIRGLLASVALDPELLLEKVSAVHPEASRPLGGPGCENPQGADPRDSPCYGMCARERVMPEGWGLCGGPQGGPGSATGRDHGTLGSAGQSFLFRYYGLILRESAGRDVVRRHLTSLLELSHQSAPQREGIALAIGLTSASHLEEVWAVLEHLGRTRFLRSPTAGADDQDNILKMSFLSAAVMLVAAIKREPGTQSYKFTQIPDLIQCLLCILQREPSFLATLLREKVIVVITGLSRLRPHLKPMVKSRILETCLQSVYALPPMELLESSLPPLQPVPDIKTLYSKTTRALNLLLQSFLSEDNSMDEIYFLLQHMETWLQSKKIHERRRALQSTSQYALDCLEHTEEASPSMLGHPLGLLTLLWRDEDALTRHHSRQCVYLLLQLLLQQRGKVLEFIHLNKMKNFEVTASREWEMKLYNVAKAFDENLMVAQHTQLVLTLLHGLCSCSHLRSDLASEFLLLIFEGPGVRREQVAEILQGLYQELPDILFKDIQSTMMKAVTILGTQHTQETIELILSLSHPSERKIIPMWKALGANTQLSRKVLTLLYMKLKLRPPKEVVVLTPQMEPISLLALGTIYELLYMKEYKATIRWAFAGILLGLLTQLRYLFELGLVSGISEKEGDTLDMKPLSPSRTCLEALKGLFWTTNYWEVFGYLKLLRGWELFEHLDTYTEGVTILARAMAHYNCEVKAVLGQAVISLKSPEERDNVVAILIISAFLNSRELMQYTSRKTMDSFLSLSLSNPNQLVRAMSLAGLSSTLMQPKKVVLLRNRLQGLLDRFLMPEPKDPLGLMEILGDILHRLGARGVGAVSLRVAQRLLQLFEDVSAAGAILLFGDVINSGGKKHRQALKDQVFPALVPLLFHLADRSPAVAQNTKFTFLRCAILLKWEFRKELFSKLTWGQGLGAENDIFIHMVESNFGSYHQFLMQAFLYLRSPHKNLKLVAMKFIGGLLQDYFSDLCFYLKKGDVRVLRKHLETLKQGQDSRSCKFYLDFLEDIMELYQYVT
ncbi:maestro heat-like repeat family member 5 [Choloepus didactylus]|uniref:maestro heat-like repeat family member 5 n=1 Tax=Choloepus didactylus TaxID=27675 RepID=UPI00189F1795|nr:maestro heat-like repeat family member 5 [Choloepus didactylus]